MGDLPLFVSCMLTLALNNDRFNCVVVRVKCESEWNAISFFPSQPFAVLAVDQSVGHGCGLLQRQKQDLSKNLYITSDVSEISVVTTKNNKSEKLKKVWNS